MFTLTAHHSIQYECKRATGVVLVCFHAIWVELSLCCAPVVSQRCDVRPSVKRRKKRTAADIDEEEEEDKAKAAAAAAAAAEAAAAAAQADAERQAARARKEASRVKRLAKKTLVNGAVSKYEHLP